MNAKTTGASPADTRTEMVKLTGRQYTVVRHILTQLPRGSAHRPSVLGPIVTSRKHRALELYLLLLTAWPWLERREPLEGAVWARALSTNKGRLWSPTNVSEAWTDLEKLGLIERKREGRSLRVTPRREDGKASYTAPGETKGDRNETYFVLPGSFWTDEVFAGLSLPGLAMLLILLAETSKDEEKWLTYNDAATWYGISPKTVQNGINDLVKLGLVNVRPEWVSAPLSRTGSTLRHWYSLTGKYSTTGRDALRQASRTEHGVRTGTRVAKKSAPKKNAGNRTAAKKTAGKGTAANKLSRPPKKSTT